MKNTLKIPRILKIKSIDGFTISCIFNNGETRTIDFSDLFKKWGIKRTDPEFILTDEKEFKKVSLRNQTLSWENLKIPLTDFEGNETYLPYELSPDVLFENSKPAIKSGHRYFFGTIIKKLRLQKGMTQVKLAEVSGTSKTYISRVENDLIEPELSTLYKIVEVGLGKSLRIEIK
jgi:DNA-binding XRE family transcriptional regulator